MNKSTLAALTAAIAACSATGALAADPPAVDWTGAYAGVNVGGAFDAKTKFDRTVGDLPNNTNALTQNLRPTAYDIKDSGLTVGGHIGYNWQMTNVVFGLEADIAYTDLDQTDTLSNTTMIGPLGAPSATPVTRVNEYTGGMDYIGTVRGRVGYAFGNTLLYATGGLAYGKVDRQITFYGPNANTTPFFQGSENGTKTGYAVGGGIEHAIATDSFLNPFNSSAVTLRAEYLHYDLGEDSLRFPGVNGGATIGGYTARVRTEGNLARVGVSYKF